MTNSVSSQRYVKHGCEGLTSSIDINRPSTIVASGGADDVGRLVLNDGVAVAMKTLRLNILLGDDEKAVTVRCFYLNLLSCAIV